MGDAPISLSRMIIPYFGIMTSVSSGAYLYLFFCIFYFVSGNQSPRQETPRCRHPTRRHARGVHFGIQRDTGLLAEQLASPEDTLLS